MKCQARDYQLRIHRSPAPPCPTNAVNRAVGQEVASSSPHFVASSLRRFVASSAPAFTLVEILVVISIIALLVGISVAAMSGMFASAATNKTNVALGQLASALTEYKAKTGGQVPEGDIEDFVDDVNTQGGSSQKMLDSLDDELVEVDSSTGNVDNVVDAWNKAVFYYDTKAGSEDLSEAKPKRPQPYFASAGADKKWGEFDSDLNPNEQAKDNIYSFDVGR